MGCNWLDCSNKQKEKVLSEFAEMQFSTRTEMSQKSSCLEEVLLTDEINLMKGMEWTHDQHSASSRFSN